jgi:2-aminoadipate transaminase
MITTANSSSNQAPPAHVVNFGCGHPDFALLPVEDIASATQQALLDDGSCGRQWLQYGRENGNDLARQALAEFISSTLYYRDSPDAKYVPTIDPETLFITSGVSHGIQLVCRTLLRMHHNLAQEQFAPLCWVEDPTYFLIPPLLEQSGYQLETVPTRPESGLDVAVLETLMQDAREAAPDRLFVLYCIPSHHNPLGVSLSESDRTRLLQLCETCQVYLIADEVYHGLSFSTEAATPTAMAMKSSSPYVISVSAFTKILCPGIRCGWIQTENRELLHMIGLDGVLDSGGCSSQLSSGIVRQLIKNGKMAKYMATVQTNFAQRCQHLCRLLKNASDGSEYPFSFDFSVPQGGYFLWCQVVGVPFTMDDPSFRSLCQSNYDVDFKTGSSCSMKGSEGSFSNCIRLCFAFYDMPMLTQGVDRLCQAIQAYSNQLQK